ncbi:MAG TPA: sigma-70 family RNA polymerase sigma factor [Terriglobia bacterium]|nr:sigma-70 family RNA polymerase sigma factor [Terriglobia bacterium]
MIVAPGKSSEQLFERIGAQDETALAELYDDLAPPLLGLILRILSSHDQAEEVLQSVFLRVWREARAGLSPAASVLAYMAQVARDAALRRLRASAPGHASSATANRSRLDSHWLPSPAQVTLMENRRELLSKLLRQLPVPQREVIDRVVFEGLTEQEIATFRTEPLGRAQDELRAGLGFLRQRLLTLVGTWTAGT